MTSIANRLSLIQGRLESIGLTVLIAVSFLWPLLNWREFHAIRQHFIGAGYVSAGLVLSEAAFITGAVLMIGAIGTEFTGRNKVQVWLKKYRYSRTSIKEIAGQAITGRAFTMGFWLNFFGAVATSLILALSVIMFLPMLGWWLLIAIGLDLIATFAWRVPLQKARVNHAN